MRGLDPVAAVLEVEVLQRTDLCCQAESPDLRQPPYLDRSTQIARLVSGGTNTMWGSAWAAARGTVCQIGDGDSRRSCRNSWMKDEDD